MRLAALKRLVDPHRPITYGIVQAGEDVEDGVPYIRPADMEPWARDLDPARLRTTHPAIAAAYGRSTVAAGDVVISIGPSYGKVLLVPERLAGANLTQGTARLAPAPSVDARFLQYSVATSIARDWWRASVGGATFGGLNLGPLSMTPVPIPPALSEQREIANLLDRECARLGGLDGALRRLAPLLNETPLARFLELTKDRPLTRLGYHYEVQLGKMLDEGKSSEGELVPYLRNQNVDWDRFDLDDVKLMPLTVSERRRYEVLPGDLLACEGRHVGKSAVWTGEISPVYFQKALHRIRPRGSWSARYLMWCLWLGNSRGDFYADGTGSTIPHLPAEKLRAVRIPWAAPADQDAIVAEVDAIRESALAAQRVTQETTARLAEYRGALITEAVTGNLDVAKPSDARLDESAHATLEGETPEVLAS